MLQFLGFVGFGLWPLAAVSLVPLWLALERPGTGASAAARLGLVFGLVACAKGHGGMAALLLERGADPALKDQEGRTASERAAQGTDACREPASK